MARIHKERSRIAELSCINKLKASPLRPPPVFGNQACVQWACAQAAPRWPAPPAPPSTAAPAQPCGHHQRTAASHAMAPHGSSPVHVGWAKSIKEGGLPECLCSRISQNEGSKGVSLSTLTHISSHGLRQRRLPHCSTGRHAPASGHPIHTQQVPCPLCHP